MTALPGRQVFGSLPVFSRWVGNANPELQLLHSHGLHVLQTETAHEYDKIISETEGAYHKVWRSREW